MASPSPTAGRFSTKGMIASANRFVDSDGMLTDASWRFLYSLFNRISRLETEVQTLQQRLANAGIP